MSEVNKVKINLNEEVTSRLSIAPIKDSTGGYKFGGLVPAIFLGTRISSQVAETGPLQGLEVKVLNFEFVNYKFNTSDPDRFLTHQEKAIAGVKKDGNSYVPMEEKTVSALILNMWGRIKHIMDVCKGLPNYRNIVEDKKFVKLIELPITTDAKVVVEAYNALFEHIHNFIMGDDKLKPMCKISDDKFVTVWLKVLPEYNDKKWYTLPTFVGTGFIELAKYNADKTLTMPVVISVRPSESLELASATKAAPAGMPNMATPGTAGMPSSIAKQLGLE